MLKKGSKFKRALSLILATAMVSQNCMITSIGGDTVSTESAQIETQAAEAAAQAEAERQAAEAAAQAEAERQAAEAAAKAEAERQAAEAAAKAESERQAAEAAAKAESERQAAEEAAKAESERQAAEEAAKAESERQAAEAAAKAESERQAAEAAAKAESERQAAEEAAKAESERQAAEEAAKEEQQTPQTEGQTESQPAATEKQTEEQKEPAKDEDKKEPEKDNDKPAKDEDKKEPAETEKKEVFYRVTFDSHAADQGKIQVKDEANPVTVDTVSTYYKEVKEKDAFTFTVVPNEDYEVEYVRADQIDIPKTEKENEYKIANVTKDTVITVTYKELPKDTEPAEDADAEEGQDTEEDGHVRNTVTFEAGVGVTVLSDGADVTNGTGQAVDGTILFTVIPTNGYEVTSVLVDGSIEARTTENANEYIIENIQTDDTIVSITTEWVGVEETETETEVETEVETETETETEIETETETEVETETETELESESETEVLMPAQEFTQTAGSTVVTVSAPEGAFPEGTTMKAVPVSADTVVAAVEDQVAAEGKEIVDVVAVDITFYDKDGKEIQPAADVAVSFGNVPVSEAAEEAAVYHIDDAANAEVVAEVAPEDTEATFQAGSFSTYALVRAASAEVLAGEEDYSDMTPVKTVTVPKGGSVEFTGTSGDSHTWQSLNSDVAEIEGHSNRQTCTIRGRKASEETVTIVHTYTTTEGYWPWGQTTEEHTEIFRVQVIEPAEDLDRDTNRVYVYVKLAVEEGVDTSGWNINKDGWYTIGYIDVPGLSDPEDHYPTRQGQSYLDSQVYNTGEQSKVTSILNENSIHYFAGNEAVARSVDLQDIDWSSSGYGLKVADGASDYEAEAPSLGNPPSGNTWHLDGLLEITKEDTQKTYTLTVNYYYKNESGTYTDADRVDVDPNPYSQKNIKTGQTVSVESPQVPGYTPSESVVERTFLERDLVVNVIYTRDTGKLTINKTLQAPDSETDSFTFKVSSEALEDVKSITVNDTAYSVIKEGNVSYVNVPIEVVGGQTAGITLDVPTGAYTVEEIASDDTGVTSGTIEVNGKTYQVKAEGNSDIVISKNGNKTASFTNSLTEEKDITVTKTWKDNDSDKRPDKGDFTVTLTGSDDSEYPISGDNWTGDSNSWSETIKVPVYKDGTPIIYTVEETPLKDYTLESSSTTSITPADGETGVELTNTLKTGSLTVSKTVNAPADMTITDPFDFTVSGFDANETVTDASGTNNYTADDNGTITVNVAAGGSVTLTVPTGVYTVSENNVTGGKVTVGSHTYTVTGESSKSVTVDSGETETASFTNTIADEVTVTVQKTWEDQNDTYELRPETNEFSVTLTGDNKRYAAGGTDVEWRKDGDNTWTAQLTVPAYDENGDKITYTVSETNISGTYAKSGTESITPADADDRSVELTNSLKTGSLSVSKTVEGLDEEDKKDDTFSFAIVPADSNVTATALVSKTAQHGETVTWENIPIGQYTVTESVSGTENHAYSTTAKIGEEDATAESGSSGLSYSVTVTEGETAQITYTNTAKTTTFDWESAELSAKKILKGRALQEGEFTFQIVDAEDPDNIVIVATGINAAADDGVAADITFTGTLTFDKIGEYTYIIKEVTPENEEEKLGGVAYSTESYEVTVEVSKDNATGGLKAELKDVSENGYIFTNTYSAGTASVTISGTKNLSGRSLEADEFNFSLVEVTDASGETVKQDGYTDTTTNAGDGTFSFSITYNTPGSRVHYYKITEQRGSETGMTYATNSYVVSVQVTDDGEGHLSAVQTDSATIIFNNSYEAESDPFQIRATKSLSGRELEDGEFTFKLEAVTAGAPMPSKNTATNQGTQILFDEITFTQEDIGTYTYKITEKEGDLNGVTYDPAEYTVPSR